MCEEQVVKKSKPLHFRFGVIGKENPWSMQIFFRHADNWKSRVTIQYRTITNSISGKLPDPIKPWIMSVAYAFTALFQKNFYTDLV